MDSTVTSTPRSLTTAPAVLDAVLLPAATCAPAALALARVDRAVDAPAPQETSALAQLVSGTGAYATWTTALAVPSAAAVAAVAGAAAPAAKPFAARIRHNAMGPAPSRGTPV